MVASGCPGTSWGPVQNRKAPCQGGAGAATSVLPPQGPGVLLGSKTGAVLELALLRLCHPVHHPGLAVGPTVAGDGVHSSFIFTCPPTPLPGGGIKSLGMTVTESPGWGGTDKVLEACGAETSLGL